MWKRADRSPVPQTQIKCWEGWWSRVSSPERGICLSKLSGAQRNYVLERGGVIWVRQQPEGTGLSFPKKKRKKKGLYLGWCVVRSVCNREYSGEVDGGLNGSVRETVLRETLHLTLAPAHKSFLSLSFSSPLSQTGPAQAFNGWGGAGRGAASLPLEHKANNANSCGK